MCGGVEDDHVHTFVADVVKSFDTVDRNILDCVLSRLGLPGWFRQVCFELLAGVRLRFKLSAGTEYLQVALSLKCMLTI